MSIRYWLTDFYCRLAVQGLRTNVRRGQRSPSLTSPVTIEPLERRQLLSAGAVAVGSQTQFNAMAEVAANPSVASDAAGDYVVVWSATLSGGTNEIKGQRYSSAVKAEGSEFTISGPTTYALSSPTVAMDEHGDFVVAWTSTNSFSYQNPLNGAGGDYAVETVLAQRYDAAGTAQGSVITVDTQNSADFFMGGPSWNYSDANVQVAMDSNGDFVVAWAFSYSGFPGNPDAVYYSIVAQKYDSSGIAQGNPLSVAKDTGLNRSAAVFTPTVGMDSQGDFIVVWQSTNNSYSSGASSIVAMRYASSGNVKGNLIDIVDGETLGPQVSPTVAMDSAGDFAVAWPNAGSIDAQSFSASGIAQGPKFVVANASSSTVLSNPKLSMNSLGDFVVAWQASGGAIDAQTYDASGKTEGSAIDIAATTALNPAVAVDSEGRFELVWQSTGNTVYGQSYLVLPSITCPSTANVNENSSLTIFTVEGNAVILTDTAASGDSDSLSLLVSHGTLTLATTSGLTFTSGANGSASMTVFGTLAKLNAAVGGLKFTPTAGYSGSASFTITIQNGRNSLSASANVAITVNAQPKVTAPTIASVNENTSLIFSAANLNAISVLDGSATASSDTVKLTATQGKLTLGSTTGITFSSGANGSATMTVFGTVAKLNAALSGLKYTPTTGYSGSASLTITVKNGHDSLSASANVAITVNALPTVTAPTIASVNENTSLTFSAAYSNAISVLDGSATASSDTVKLTVTHGKLTLGSSSGITFTSGGNGSATMTMWGTLANLNAALGGLKFTPATGYMGSASLAITVKDGRDNLTGSVNVAITVNAPPTVTAPTTASVNKNTSLTFSKAHLNAISVLDGSATAGSDTMKLTVTHGKLILGSTTGIKFTSGANGSATMTIWGTLANLNAALSGLKFTPTTSYSGSASLAITIQNGRDSLMAMAKVAITVKTA